MPRFWEPFWGGPSSTRIPEHIKRSQAWTSDLLREDTERNERSEESQRFTSSKREHYGGQTSISNKRKGNDQNAELQLLQLKQEMMLISERSRREIEIHLEEKARRDKTISALQSDHELLLRQVKSFKPAFEPMDDTTCEMTIKEIFRTLQVWCFSHFAERSQRSEIRSIISRDICNFISSLSLGASEETLEYTNRLENEIMRTTDASQAHVWRVSTLRADAQIINSEEIINNYSNNMDNQFASVAKPAKEGNRKRALRKILEKSMVFRTRLHEQEAKYYLEWISPGTQFSDKTMVVDTQDRLESTSKQIKYCFRPLVWKVVRMPFRGYDLDSITVVSANVSF